VDFNENPSPPEGEGKGEGVILSTNVVIRSAAKDLLFRIWQRGELSNALRPENGFMLGVLQ